MFYIECNSTLLLHLHSKFLPVFLPFVSLPHSVFSCPFLLFSSSFIQLMLLVECLYLCISFSLYFVLYSLSLCLPRCLFSLAGVFNSWAILVPLLLKSFLNVSFMLPWSHPLRQMRLWNNLTPACSIVWSINGMHKPLTTLHASLHCAVRQCIIVYFTSLLCSYPPKNFLNISYRGRTVIEARISKYWKYPYFTQLSIPTHEQIQRHRLKFIKNHLKNSYMFRSSTIFRELQCPR